MLKFGLLVSLSLLFARGRDVPIDERFQWCKENQMASCKVTPYKQTSISKYIEKKRLGFFLQNAFDQLNGVGFKHFGHDADFFHGHYIHNKKFEGVLYHTQELASLYEKVDKSHKYSYLNEYKRNWIQFYNEEKIKNANQFISIAGLSDKAFKGFRENYTITSKMLDTTRLSGSQEEFKSLQFTFYKMVCPQEINKTSNVIKVSGHKRNTICVVVH